MIDISMLINKQNKNQNTSWISLCGKLEAYIGNYFLSGASIPDNKIETLYYDASIDKDDSVELIERNIVAYYMDLYLYVLWISCSAGSRRNRIDLGFDHLWKAG